MTDYIQQTWVDGPAGGTPIDAARLNHMEVGILEASNSYFNVKRYGAKGDDFTDDTAAIVATMAAIDAAGGGICFFPAGTYLVNPYPHPENASYYAGIIVGDNVTLQGSGRTMTTIKLADGQTHGMDLGNNVCVIENLHFSSGSHDIVIRDLTVDGNSPQQMHNQAGICMLRVENCTVENVLVRDCRGTANSGANETFHIELGLSSNISVINCEVQGMGPGTDQTSDTFSRADSASTMGVTEDSGALSWTPVTSGSIWGTSASQAYNPSATSQAIAVVESSHSNCDIQATLVAGVDYGLCWRVLDDDNNWIMNLDSVYAKVAGSYNLVCALADGPNTAGDVLRVSLKGPVHKIYRNGVVVAEFSNNFNRHATKHGLRANADSSARWDAFSIGYSRTASGFAADGSIGVRYVDCVAHHMGYTNGFTHNGCVGISYADCWSYSNAGSGFNSEVSVDVLYSNCLAGGKASANSVPFATNDLLGNDNGFVLDITKDVAMSGCSASSNSTGYVFAGNVRATLTSCIARNNSAYGMAYDTDCMNFGGVRASGTVFFSNDTDIIGPSPYNGFGEPPLAIIPPMPATGVPFFNPFPFDCMIYISGGTVSGIELTGTPPAGLTSGSFFLRAGNPSINSIQIDYSDAPVWIWYLQ